MWVEGVQLLQTGQNSISAQYSVCKSSLKIAAFPEDKSLSPLKHQAQTLTKSKDNLILHALVAQ